MPRPQGLPPPKQATERVLLLCTLAKACARTRLAEAGGLAAVLCLAVLAGGVDIHVPGLPVRAAARPPPALSAARPKCHSGGGLPACGRAADTAELGQATRALLRGLEARVSFGQTEPCTTWLLVRPAPSLPCTGRFRQTQDTGSRSVASTSPTFLCCFVPHIGSRLAAARTWAAGQGQGHAPPKQAMEIRPHSPTTLWEHAPAPRGAKLAILLQPSTSQRLPTTLTSAALQPQSNFKLSMS